MLEPSLKATEDKNGASLGCVNQIYMSIKIYDMATLVSENMNECGNFTLVSSKKRVYEVHWAADLQSFYRKPRAKISCKNLIHST